MARVKPLCHHQCLRDFNQPVLGKTLLAVTAALEPPTIKGVSNTMESWGHSKSAKADFKESSKSVTFNKHSKRERTDTNKNYDSWNKAKKRLKPDEINRRRNTGACMNCGEVGHVFKDCPKPKP